MSSSTRHKRRRGDGGSGGVEAKKFHLDDTKLLNEVAMDTDGAGLTVEKVNQQTTANRAAHNTNEYEHNKLIVRRGQSFKITLTFDRPPNLDEDKVTLQLVFGDQPKISKGTLLRLTLRKDAIKSTTGWSAQAVKHDGNSVEVDITPASRAIVGEYGLYVETMVMADGKRHLHRKKCEDTLILLFNPWCKDDDVYLKDAKERAEYILNESGRLWGGNRSRYGGFPWNFGQFDDVSLDCALYLLKLGKLTPRARTNPVQVIRSLAALANSSDEDGVLTGRWDGIYPKGTSNPSSWTGSTAILDRYMKTKTPVEYGQCWVFSGVLTTLLRSLGIPTRSVTNFESAHDTDASNTIDFHFNQDDEPLSDFDDSVWNFHVWNESWCKRHDLPEGHDGWQAHDATPQEESGGISRCGPASMKAIKEGLVYLPYDTAFIFSEVNGDRVNWKENADEEFEVSYVDKKTIGFDISTKAAGSFARHDLTSQYKHQEGSAEERVAVEKACCHSGIASSLYDEPAHLVDFKMVVPEAVALGEDFDVGVQLTNVSEETQEVKGRFTVVLARYTGVVNDRVLSKPFTKKLKATKEDEVSVHVSIDDYQHLFKQEAVVQVYLSAKITDSKQAYARQQSFFLTKPTLVITAPDKIEIGEEFTLSMKLTNPLQDALTSGVFLIEAPGITKSTSVPLSEPVPPGAEVEEEVLLSATRSGNKEIVVRFTSDQIAGMSGTREIYIKYSS